MTGAEGVGISRVKHRVSEATAVQKWGSVTPCIFVYSFPCNVPFEPKLTLCHFTEPIQELPRMKLLSLIYLISLNINIKLN